MSTKELPSRISEVQRRLKRGYQIERTGGGHFRIRDAEGEFVLYRGKAITLMSRPSPGVQRAWEEQLTEAGVLKAKGGKTLRPRRTEAEQAKARRGVEKMRATHRAAQAERKKKANALRDEMTPWMTKLGGPSRGTVWDLAHYLHQHGNGTFSSPDSAAHTIRRVMEGDAVKDETREELRKLHELFAVQPDPLAFYVDLAREARGIDHSGVMGGVALPAGQEWPFTVQLVELAACFPDESYQRPSPDRFVRELVLNFDERLVGAIEVSDRGDGTFAILDGQTRWRAMQVVGKKRCYAAIYEDMDVAAEARFFYRVNKHRKAVHPYYGYRARLLSGEEKVVAINRLVEAAGLKVTTHTAGEQGGIAAVTALEWVYDLSSPVREDTLSPVLRIFGTLWRGLKKSTDAELLRGFGRFYAAYADAEIEVEHFDELLQSFGPTLVLARARDVAGAGRGAKAGTGLSAAKAIVSIHNTGLRSNVRLDQMKLERV